MKYQALANIGDTIRAYDFMGNKEAFIEGVIVDKGIIKHPVHGYEMYDGYTINITSDGSGWDREGDQGYIAFETSADYDGRVELMIEAA